MKMFLDGYLKSIFIKIIIEIIHFYQHPYVSFAIFLSGYSSEIALLDNTYILTCDINIDLLKSQTHKVNS